MLQPATHAFAWSGIAESLRTLRQKPCSSPNHLRRSYIGLYSPHSRFRGFPKPQITPDRSLFPQRAVVSGRRSRDTQLLLLLRCCRNFSRKNKFHDATNLLLLCTIRVLHAWRTALSIPSRQHYAFMNIRASRVSG